jgi:plastocyanin
VRRLLPLLALAFVLVPPSNARPAAGVLLASVGPDFTISLTDEAGAPVTRVEPGIYSIRVVDRSTVHNFHLHGPGLNRDSGQAATGDSEWTVELREGYFTFVCDPHAESMRGSFVAGTPPPPSIALTVDGGGVSVGGTAGSVPPGVYAIEVHDRSASDNLRLVGPEVEEHTQLHARSDVTWLVTLRDGVYHVFSDSRPATDRTFTVGSGAQPPRTTALRASVGSDVALTLLNSDSSPVTRLAAGTYTIEVDDRSADHNFHLEGPGVSQATTVEEVGVRQWTVRLSGGFYVFVCDPHRQVMRSLFSVQSPPAPTLRASLSAAGRAALAPRRVAAGAYVVVVRDSSRRAGFALRGPGVSRATGAAFVGTARWRVTLAAGTYRWGATPRPRGILRVA